MAQDVAEALALDRLIFIPAGSPPHKSPADVTPASVRLEMVREAAAGNDTMEVSEVELGREGPSYTVDTLRHFREMRPGAELFFIMGTDQVAEFHTWRDPEIVAELATLVAMTRAGWDPEQEPSGVLASGAEVSFRRVPVTRIDLSSTDIRERAAAGRSIRYLVPDGVRSVIESRQLYPST